MIPKDLDPDTGLPFLARDLGMRLKDSVVMFNKRPVYVDVIEGTTLGVQDLLSGEQIAVNLPHDSLDIRPVPLGYINTERGTYYAARVPVRRYKQGLNTSNLRLHNNGSVRISSLLTSKALGRCIMGSYPSFSVALRNALEGKPRAWARRWAVYGDDVSYRGRRVGHVSNRSVVLDGSYLFLKEELEASL